MGQFMATARYVKLAAAKFPRSDCQARDRLDARLACLDSSARSAWL